jgi:hypothetical protein
LKKRHQISTVFRLILFLSITLKFILSLVSQGLGSLQGNFWWLGDLLLYMSSFIVVCYSVPIPWFRIIASWIQSLMVYEIENAKITLRAFGQTQFITCIFWKSIMSWMILSRKQLFDLGSKVKVPRRSLRYATHRLMVMHPHTKYNWPIWKDKPGALKSL